MREVCAPKLTGAARLQEHATQHALQQLSVFSSVASLLGSSGQANYAAANSAMDSWSSSLQTQVCIFMLGKSCNYPDLLCNFEVH